MARRITFICDCCGREVKEVRECYKNIERNNSDETWELCAYCLSRLNHAFEDRIKEIKNDQSLGLI